MSNQIFDNRVKYAKENVSKQMTYLPKTQQADFVKLLTYRKRYGHTAENGWTIDKYEKMDNEYIKAKMKPPGYGKLG